MTNFNNYYKLIDVTREESLLFEQLYKEFYTKDDKSAFELLYGTFRLHFIRYINKCIKDEQISENFTQDLFMKIFKKELPISSSSVAYAYVIAKNLGLDYIRRQHTEKRILSRHYNIVQFDKEIYFAEDFSAVLSKSELSLVALRYAKGFKIKELAIILKTSERTLNRKFKIIKAKIKEYCKENNNIDLS